MNALAFVLGFLPIVDLAADTVRQPLSPRIDAAILKHASGQAPRPIAGDSEFLRRVSLDLTGSIPSVERTRAFLADRRPDRRVRLVDELLAGPDYARHWSTMWDVALMDRRPGDQVKLPEWQTYLRQSLAENKPIDRLVRELLNTDGSQPKNRAPARFLLDRKVEPHLATRDIGRLFLGMNLTCCQCHDHPLIDGFKQEFYFGIYAFLNRTYAFADKKTKVAVLAEKAEGDVSFESVFKPKDVRRIGLKLPLAKELAEPTLAKGKEYVAPVAKGERGIPTYSRRARLGDEITNHPYFSRTITNRVWSWLMGRGIIHPVEYDHEGNPPSNPDLLTLLAADFHDNGHDLKRLIRGIVHSEAYQRTSESSNAADAPGPERFLAGAIRPLTPEQLAWSLARATGQIDAEMTSKTTEAAVIAKLTPAVQPVVALFASAPGEPAVNLDFEATLDQALFLSYGKTLETWLAPRPGSLTGRLGKMADDAALADELYLSVFVRRPSDDERQDVVSFLHRPGIERGQAIRDLVWACVTSAEFRFNH